jgi:hypothetical protein
LKINWLLAALTILLLSQSTFGQAHENCASIVTSAQDAADKADWVIEGDIINTLRLNSPSARIEVSIENAKVLYELERSPRFFTAVLPVDSCFPDSAAVLWGKAADKLIGKRMRFFGTKLTSARGRRIFFMQPAEQAMPSFPKVRREYATKENLPNAVKTSSDGWSRARSTDGAFSIEMPGPFVDITKTDGGQPGFMLRGTDHYGSTFIAVFERSGPDSGMGGTFDATISKPNANTTVFKGAEAVYTLGELPGGDGKKITHGLWFRVPGGTYMLGVVTSKEHEAESLKFKDRFFNSLTFE